ncbi:MAG TPA: dihydroorotate dehydrogenase [Clostridia bacterium]|jgi:dihydroorotate dehydrogenase (NAD+) catalytic subunit
MNLSVNICGIEFKNPLIAASGTFGFGREYKTFYDVNIWGGICTKGLTYEKRLGNPVPRIAETPMGVLNSVGLQNPGFEEFVKYELPYLKTLNSVVIVNIAGSVIEDYCRLAEALNDCDIDMVELNISCPNVKEGGMAFGTRPESIKNVVTNVRKYCKKPLIVKLSPNVEDIAKNAKVAEDSGADAISLINTVSGMAVDIYTRQPILARGIGGLSGPAIKPIALKMVWQVYNAVKIPIIGMGGISSAKDVLEFMLCGARAVQIGTYNFMNPNAPVTILDDLTKLMAECKIQDINTIVGDLKAR